MQSENIDQLMTALVAARAEFPIIPRTRKAKVQMRTGGTYEYTYADLSDVLAAVVPMLCAHGLVLTHLVEGTPGVATVTTQLSHVSGQFIAATLSLSVSGETPQAMGTGLTYARRYGTTGLLGIATEDDTDAQDHEATPRAAAPGRFATKDQLHKLREQAVEAGLDLKVYDETVARATYDGQVPLDRFDLIAAKVRERLAERTPDFEDKSFEQADLLGTNT